MLRPLRLPSAMRGSSPRFMPIWLRRNSSQSNISSMRDMLLLPISSRRNLTMGWTWLAPPSRRTGIKRRLATTSRISPSIGKPRRSPVPRDGPVRAGHRSQMQALFAARSRESTEDFKDTYRHRAGIEGTHSQAVRTMGLRRSRYIGLHKTHLGHVAIAAAVNVIQLMSWLRGEAPEQTRTSAFKRVMEQAA